MKLIVAGSRQFDDWPFIEQILYEDIPFHIEYIVSGMAKGPDTYGYEWAKLNDKPCMVFPADWEKYGKRAGYIRNQQMAEVATALVAFWDGTSKGTKSMIDLAIKHGLWVKVIYV